MASAGGGIDEATVTTKKKKRISDCLVDSDGGDEPDAEPPSPPSPGTPRLRIPMFTCARLRFVRLGKKGGGRRKEVVAEKTEAASVDSAGWKQGSNGGSGAEAAGMGLSLLFLLAKTCVELNKMAEVRAQMETLLEEMRDLQLVRTTKTNTDSQAPVTGSTTHDIQPSSSTTTASPCRCRRSAGTRTDGRARAGPSCSLEPSRPRRYRKRRDESFYALTGNPLFDLDRAAASTSGLETASRQSEMTTSEVEDPTGMTIDIDAVGARFFELNNCNTVQGTPESSSDSDGDSFIELEGGFGAGAGKSARRRRDSEDEDSEDEERGSDEGVSALELERRLQELLHRKSRERIEELEASLRRAERKLMEKDMEAQLWKDTAKLALQPPPQAAAARTVNFS